MLGVLVLALQSDLPDALRRTRSASSYEVAFSSRTTVERGDPLNRAGTVRWWKSGVLIVDYEGSGQEQVQAVRAGVQYACGEHEPDFTRSDCPLCKRPRNPTPRPRVWVHGGPGWLRADESPNPGAALGIQDPDELLRLLREHEDRAKETTVGYEIRLEGDAALLLARKLNPGKDMGADNGSILVRIRVALGRVTAVDVDAELSGPKGSARFQARCGISNFGEVTVPPHLGPVKAPVRFSPAIKDALAEALQ